MNRKATFFIAIFLISLLTTAKLPAQKRFKQAIFPMIDSAANIQYGEALNIKGEQEKLLLNIYTPPKGDTMKHRPLLIFIHGGGFQNNTRFGTYGSMICTKMAQRGYVTATIDYRLGIEGTKSNKNLFGNGLYASSRCTQRN